MLEITSSTPGRDGRFTFALDRAQIPENTRLFATAVRLDGGVRWAGASDQRDVPARDDSPDAVERASVSLGPINLGKTPRLLIQVTAGGVGVPRADVQIDADTSLAGTTDLSGRFELLVAAKEATVVIRRDGLSSESAHVTLEDASAVVSIDLAPPASLAVRVIGPDGASIANADVSALSAQGVTISEGSTDEVGRATLEGLATGKSYSISVSSQGNSTDAAVPLAGNSADVTLPSGEVTIQLTPSGAVDVQLTFEPDLAHFLETQDLECRLDQRGDDGTWHVGFQDWSSKERKRRFSPLEAGTYRVCLVSHDEQHLALSFTEPLEVKPGVPVSATLLVGHGRSVTGWVTDEQGAPIDADATLEETGAKISIKGGWIDLRLPRSPMHLVLVTEGRQDRAVTIAPDATSLGETILAPKAATSAN